MGADAQGKLGVELAGDDAVDCDVASVFKVARTVVSEEAEAASLQHDAVSLVDDETDGRAGDAAVVGWADLLSSEDSAARSVLLSAGAPCDAVGSTSGSSLNGGAGEAADTKGSSNGSLANDDGGVSVATNGACSVGGVPFGVP